MSDAIGRDLAEARRALQEGRAEDALDHALAAWRTLRSPLLAELVERIDALLEAAPLRAAPEAWHEAWLARESARRPADLGALIRALAGSGDGSGTWVTAFQRLERIAEWPDDPRLAAGLVDLFEAPPFSSPKSTPFYAQAARLLVQQRDPRASKRLRDLQPAGAAQAHVEPARKEAIARLKEAGARKAAPLDPAIEALARATLEACPRPRLDLLIERVHAHPDDDAARAAYADALSARGDARGEYILLALRRHAGETLSTEEQRRADALLKAHRAAWLGPLARCALPFSVDFERGFPAALSVTGDATAVAEVRGHPALSTLHEIDLGFGPPGFVHPVLRHVQRARRVRDADLVAFATTEAGASLEDLAWDGPALDEAGRIDEAVLRALASPEALPRLQRLHLCPSGPVHRFGPACLAPILAAPVVARLRRLSCAFDPSALGQWLTLLAMHAPRLAALDLTPPAYSANLVIHLDRGQDGGLGALSADLLAEGPSLTREAAPARREALHALARALEEVDPDALTALHIEGDRAARPEPEQLAEFTRATERFPRLDAPSRAEIADRARWAASRRAERRAEVVVTDTASGDARILRDRALDLVPEEPGRARLVWVGPVLFLVPGRDDRSVRFTGSAAKQVWNPVEDGDEIEVGARRFRVTIEDVADTREEARPFEATYETWVQLAHRRSLSHRGAVRAEAEPGRLAIGPITWQPWERRYPPAVDAALGDLFAAALILNEGGRGAGALSEEQVRQRLAGVYAPNLGVDGEQLVCMVSHEGWSGPQDRQIYASACGEVPLAALPIDEAAFVEVAARLQSAASWMMQGAVLACRFCRTVYEPARMHTPAVCEACAERWLGVVRGIP